MAGRSPRAAVAESGWITVGAVAPPAARTTTPDTTTAAIAIPNQSRFIGRLFLGLLGSTTSDLLFPCGLLLVRLIVPERPSSRRLTLCEPSLVQVSMS